jgi:hypothetical protein
MRPFFGEFAMITPFIRKNPSEISIAKKLLYETKIFFENNSGNSC